jgi:hypothetical protein
MCIILIIVSFSTESRLFTKLKFVFSFLACRFSLQRHNLLRKTCTSLSLSLSLCRCFKCSSWDTEETR